MPENPTGDVATTVQNMKSAGSQCAVATVVRTVSVTAAKPGAKAVINADGKVIEGWIGGGCARSAVVKAAVKAIEDGQPRLVSLQPEELLKEQGMTAGDDNQGVVAAKNMCPSQGSMDIFVEPVLADPELLILGASPVALVLAELGRGQGFSVVMACNEVARQTNDTIKQYKDIPAIHQQRYIVVATQGSGDLDALQMALSLSARQISFVGSAKKTAHLKSKLHDLHKDTAAIAGIKGPAGLDIGALTPQEIALSILAEIIQWRRQKSATD